MIVFFGLFQTWFERLDEWQMFDRKALFDIQDEEEEKFKSLPDEVQKLVKLHNVSEEKSSTEESQEIEPKVANHDDEKRGDEPCDSVEVQNDSDKQGENNDKINKITELPPLISEENQELKQRLLSEGFADWGRSHYNNFIKASAKYGRDSFVKIAVNVDKLQIAIEDFARAFRSEDIGKKRIPENVYDRAVKSIEIGEKKLKNRESLEKATRIFISLFDNPWTEMEFLFTHCKDKLFTQDEDRHLLCWAHKVRNGRNLLSMYVRTLRSIAII